MPTATDQPGLFDIPASPEPSPTDSQEDKRTPAQRIVAAYVDSHRRAHGTDPLKGDIGRVARDTRALLEQATESELVRAADQLGVSVYANLGVQLKKDRERSRRPISQGCAPPLAHGATEWQEGVAAMEAEAAQRAAADPAVAAWLAGVA